MRRLPVYLLVDCSESMAGDAIADVQNGIMSLLSYLRTDPQALETVYLSVITFSNSAKQVTPLSELIQFRIPELIMGSGTALGAALELWDDCIKRDVVRSTPETKGDYKPICFILTDGEPTDNWESAADIIKAQVLGRKATVVAIACGPDASVSKLKRITDDVLLTKNDNSEALKAIFKWISASVATASQAIGKNPRASLDLDKLHTENLEKIDDYSQIKEPTPSRFVFLHSKCVKTGKFYIMRYEKQANNSIYAGITAHKVENFDLSSNTKESLNISTSQLVNHQACPYCGNNTWGRCHCGHLHCVPPYVGIELTCPWCESKNIFQVNNCFDIKKGLG